MKEIIVAAVTGAILLVVATSLLRFCHIDQRARALLFVFIACFGVLIALYKLTPNDLGFLPLWAVPPSQAVGLLFAAFLFTSGFLGGVLQLYNLADRGLSLRMLIDIAENPAAAVPTGDMVRSYSAGRGLEWMYDKRITGMVQTGLITVDAHEAHITPRGSNLARLFERLQIFTG